jgi:hypothetical protein
VRRRKVFKDRIFISQKRAKNFGVEFCKKIPFPRHSQCAVKFNNMKMCEKKSFFGLNYRGREERDESFREKPLVITKLTTAGDAVGASSQQFQFGFGSRVLWCDNHDYFFSLGGILKVW